MKKKPTLIIAAIALIAVLCSFKYSNREGGEIKCDGQQMEKLYYCGHSYICYRFYAKSNFSKGYSYGLGGASIVHDPDCKCGKNK